MPDNIIPFVPKCEISIRTERQLRPAKCRHRHELEIDPETRTVTCAVCGAHVDPFEVLEMVYKNEISLSRSQMRLREEVKRLQNERDELGKEIRRMKAQKQYWGKKTAKAGATYEKN